VTQSGILGVSAVMGLQGCGYVCNGYQWEVCKRSIRASG